MRDNRSYHLLIAFLSLAFMIGCGKKSPDKPTVKSAREPSISAKNSTAKDSAGSTSNDSIRIADSLAAHPMTYEQRQGKYVYSKYCAVCHGNEGKADGFNTYNLDPKPRDLTEQHYLSEFSDERLIQIIRDGGRGANKSPSMPPYGWTLGKDDIAYVAAFVRTFMPPDVPRKQK